MELNLLKKLKEKFAPKNNIKSSYIIKAYPKEGVETFTYTSIPSKIERGVLTEYRLNDKVIYPFNLEEKEFDLFFSSAPERNKRILTIAQALTKGTIIPTKAIMELRKEEELKRLNINRKRLIKVHALRERE